MDEMLARYSASAGARNDSVAQIGPSRPWAMPASLCASAAASDRTTAPIISEPEHTEIKCKVKEKAEGIIEAASLKTKRTLFPKLVPPFFLARNGSELRVSRRRTAIE